MAFLRRNGIITSYGITEDRIHSGSCRRETVDVLKKATWTFPFVQQMAGSAPVAVAVSSNGRYAASGGHDAVVRIWDLQTVPRNLGPVQKDADLELRTVEKPKKLLECDEAIALAEKGDPQAIPSLFWYAYHWRYSYRSALALSRIEDASVNPLLLSLLDHVSEPVRWVAIRALRGRADEKTIGTVLDLLKNGSRYSKAAAASILGKTGGPGAEELLVQLLKDDEAELRLRAAWALGNLRYMGATTELLPLAEDPNAGVREWGAFALGVGGDERAGKPLKKLLGDPDPRIRWRTQKAINKWKKRYPDSAELITKPVEHPVLEIDDVVRRVKDPVVEGVEWVIYKTLFVGRVQNRKLRNFEEFLDAREMQRITVNNLAFGEQHVWAATDLGAFCFERKTRGWVEYAVNREHVGLPVKEIEVGKDGMVTFRMDVEGEEKTFVLDTKTSAWTAK